MASELVLEARRQIFRVKFLRCFKIGVVLETRSRFFRVGQSP